MILRTARSSTDAQVLHRLHDHRGAGKWGERSTQAPDNSIGTHAPLRPGSEADKHAGRIGAAAGGATGRTGNARNCRIGSDGERKLRQEPAHRLKGGVLVGIERAREATSVLLRKESLGNRHIEIPGQSHRREVHRHRDPWVAQHCQQHPFIPGSHTGEHPLHAPIERAAWPLVGRPQQSGAHHRCERERHHHRHANGDRKRHGEFAEQPPHNSAHQENRNKNRHQRHANREDGEGDLPAP